MYEVEVDLDLGGPGLPLRYLRYYNSQNESGGSLGYGWTGSFSERLTVEADRIVLREASGREVHFPDDGSGTFVSEADRVRTIVALGDGHLLIEPDGRTLSFDADGKLVQIADRNGNAQTVAYDANGRIAAVTDDFGRQLVFTRDAAGKLATLTTPAGNFVYARVGDNLATATKPDGTFREYRYEDPSDPHNLTGVVDENGTLFVEFAYDDRDRAVRSTHLDGTEDVAIAYEEGLTRRVTDGRGNTTEFALDARHGMGRVAASAGGGCGSCPASSGGSFSTDDRFRVETRTDDRGHVTRHAYDDRGNILSVTEAEGTAEERTTEFAWRPEFNLPTSVARPSVSGGTVVDEYEYDANGNLLRLTEAVGTSLERTTTFAWDGYGRMTGIDGPRADATDTATFAYYPAAQGGQLHTVANGEGHVTTFQDYDAFGNPRTATDPNGVSTTFVYDAMGRTVSETTAGLTAEYVHDDAGRLETIVLPGNRIVSYDRTASGLLKSIGDNAGNSIVFSRDAEGNPIREEVRGAGDALEKYVDYEYDGFNRLWKVLHPGDGSPYEEYGYDGNDNPTSFRNANGHATNFVYDALDRLEREIRPGGATTELDRDPADNLTAVTDPGLNATTYVPDDLGRRTEVHSPDAGITVYANDPAGNVISRADANGVTATYGYDALNRLTSVVFPDSSQNLSYGYDAGTYGKGRLTSATDPAGSSGFVHDALGRVTSEDRVTDGVPYQTGYAYDPATGDLSGMTYPSGLTLDFQYDANGRVFGITSGGQTLVGSVAYKPFGPIKSMDLGPLSLTRSYDQRYQVTGIQAGTVLNYGYTHDGAGNVETISGLPNPDLPPRLTGMTYNANRMATQNTDWIGAGVVLISPAAVYSYDNAGNIVSDGLHTDYFHNQNNRLIRVEIDGLTVAEYAYDAFERRVMKVVNGVTTHFHYDLNGLLISETDGNGNPRMYAASIRSIFHPKNDRALQAQTG